MCGDGMDTLKSSAVSFVVLTTYTCQRMTGMFLSMMDRRESAVNSVFALVATSVASYAHMESGSNHTKTQQVAEERRTAPFECVCVWRGGGGGRGA